MTPRGQQPKQQQREEEQKATKEGAAAAERKSLREKLADEAGELAVFLRERRAVSESRGAIQYKNKNCPEDCPKNCPEKPF